MSKTLSIVIPCYNEKKTIVEIVQKIENANIGDIKKEIIIVDDGSTDGTREYLKKLEPKHKVIFHKKNSGKGAALRTGFKAITGDITIIQDADLEYNPDNYLSLISPIIKGETKVVYGSRYLNKKNRSAHKLYYIGGQGVTFFTNILFGSRLTDEPTCYKVFESSLLKSIPLKCTGFEFCPEVTAHILKRKIKILEVPIDYFPRKINEGKKLKIKDGFIAIWILFKEKLSMNKKESL